MEIRADIIKEEKESLKWSFIVTYYITLVYSCNGVMYTKRIEAPLEYKCGSTYINILVDALNNENIAFCSKLY